MAARDDRGGVLVEFAAYLPTTLILILVVFELFVIPSTVERVENAARTGARVASQRHDAQACVPAANAALPDWLNESSVEPGGRDDGVSCKVQAKVPLLVPGIPVDFTITRTVNMPMG